MSNLTTKNMRSSETFFKQFDRNSGALFNDVQFESCVFDNCAISLTKDCSLRSTVRNVRLLNCEAKSCGIGPAIFEDVTVDGLKTNDLLILWSPLFRRVTLEGKIGKLKINLAAHHVDRSDATQRPFDDAREAYYSGDEWALDISKAKFQEFDMHGVPARLVRRDPETQVVVSRKNALRDGWREQLSSWNDYWPFVIDMFLEDEEEDIVLVAPKGKPKKKFTESLNGINELCDIGVAVR